MASTSFHLSDQPQSLPSNANNGTSKQSNELKAMTTSVDKLFGDINMMSTDSFHKSTVTERTLHNPSVLHATNNSKNDIPSSTSTNKSHSQPPNFIPHQQPQPQPAMNTSAVSSSSKSMQSQSQSFEATSSKSDVCFVFCICIVFNF